ncbi:MAG: ATP-binding protein [Treponema sp.]|nr:ATP-binding protein [Treponema sp.]
MENIFSGFGKVVEGKSFIGRKKLIEEYRTRFLTSGSKSNLSIVGLPRSGKTSFIKEVFRTIPDNMLYVYLSLNNFTRYQDIWIVLFDTVKEQLDSMGKKCEDNLFSFYTQERTSHLDLNKAISKVCSFLSKEGLETIIVLDEFDSAQHLFENKTEYYGVFRTVFYEYSNITGILISRKQLHTIEGKTPEGSTFSGIFSLDLFKGFSDEDMKEYYSVFSNGGYELSSEEKEQIQYYAGTLPFFLAILGNEIVQNINQKKKIDIVGSFKSTNCEKIRQEYDRIINFLKEDGNLYKLISILLGPKIVISQNDIDELKNLGYLYDDLETDGYIGISKYFRDFLKWKNLRIDPHKSIGIVEETTRKLLIQHKAELFSKYSFNNNDDDNWRDVLRKAGINEYKLKNVYDKFIDTTRKNNNPSAEYFDVISLESSFKIIENEWDIFSKYFIERTLNEWKCMFDEISRIRNPIAHNHKDWVSDRDLKLVDDYCNEIIKSIEVATNNEHKEKNDQLDNIDKETLYLFKCEKLNCRDSLRGKLETGDDCVIPKEYYSNVSNSPIDLIGKELQVRIVSKKPTGSGYICKLVSL